MKREFSAGGIVYKSQRLWLVRRPRANPEYKGNLGWSFPKGWIDDGEKTEEAAKREVREEGGVEVKIISKLPTLKIFFTDQQGEKIMKFITYFVMELEREVAGGAGWETEEVRWVTAQEAEKLLAYRSERELLKLAVKLIE
ncbi:MAG: AP4A hydrolase [Candidatus Amesbacteria bacterium GW2011_GWB1_47_19]|nr:MAG: AP4A hydrolase [Candidatus Amesbacteria bacterium GW2011_GWA1_44_24]KKU32152.1 MAG: NUDIX hydrolase [Candidatus Amesbacteria bacterium GW2011_GWC1_46_24]KKU67836.1 MAG: AP4A hydrolase [Candidatus Amesbacteria bacterium GW2011_GWB1_47_19]OGD05002.1 MAG: hypothetical protein A2379_03795 [Candidatus Amesbacteria bacterium RIFOXYB1_FULL_47_13]HBC72434.1 hypothetical protein [Candidatus Amesbacteria bacterium]